MFQQLTKYLVQYRRVSIPFVGTIRVVQQPSQLQVAEKVLLPPAYAAELERDDHVPAHQLYYLADVLNKETEDVRQLLDETGQWLKEKIAGEGFHWNGVGLIRDSGIQPALTIPAMASIPAERVLRQNPDHQVLVGDQQTTSRQLAEGHDGAVTKHKRSLIDLIGWIALVLAILYIVFVLYQGRFRLRTTGSRQTTTSYRVPVFNDRTTGSNTAFLR